MDGASLSIKAFMNTKLQKARNMITTNTQTKWTLQTNWSECYKIKTLRRVLRIWVTTASVISYTRVTTQTWFSYSLPFRRTTDRSVLINDKFPEICNALDQCQEHLVALPSGLRRWGKFTSLFGGVGLNPTAAKFPVPSCELRSYTARLNHRGRYCLTLMFTQNIIFFSCFIKSTLQYPLRLYFSFVASLQERSPFAYGEPADKLLDQSFSFNKIVFCQLLFFFWITTK